MSANKQPMVEIRDLTVHYETGEGIVEAVNHISLDIHKGEVLGLVGETGAGKTTVALSMMKLLPVPPSSVIGGSITVDGTDILHKTNKQMQKLRGKLMSMIFQDPMTALNPVKYVGDQISEVILLHEKCSKKQAVERAMDMMRKVGIMPERYKEYPHQFSGGMKQRIVIAIALACRPKVLIADEPTTALDVTIQAQMLEMMRELQREDDTAMLMITHDLGVVAEMCDKCAIIYAGEIVEYGSLEDIFDRTAHPYTLGLLASIPSLDKDVDRLRPIPGLMIDPSNLPDNCSFCTRCDKRLEKCKAEDPRLLEIAPGHYAKCFWAQEGY